VTKKKTGTVAAHDQVVHHDYLIHYPPHDPREGDPHYADFNAYHRRTRKTARCYIGERIGYHQCQDPQGNACLPPDDGGEQPGLELHHTHIEFALQNGVNLEALEKDYPGVSDPDKVGAWVESGTNFRWLCCRHHRGIAGAHTLAHADYEASQYVPGLVDKLDE
jgi:hypothetical protein